MLKHINRILYGANKRQTNHGKFSKALTFCKCGCFEDKWTDCVARISGLVYIEYICIIYTFKTMKSGMTRKL